MRLSNIVLAAATAVFASASWADVDVTPKPEGLTIAGEVSADANELVLEIKDKVEVTNACDFYVSKFQYYTAPQKKIRVEIGQEPCFLDVMGKRKATLKWNLPVSLRRHSEICLWVNDRPAGKIKISGTTTTVDPDLTESCLY